MRVYHFSGADHALENVRLRRLKIATLRDINDPFELAVCCSDKARRQALRATRRDWADKFGMLCFSKSWHNPVQWSHYADRHRGICLGFDVPDELLVPVRYSKAPPQLDWNAIELGGPKAEAEMIRWSSTKFEHWAYENEFRLFVRLEESDLEGRYFADFGDELRLQEIVVGPTSTMTQQDVYGALNGLNGIDCLKTRLAFRGYRVVKQHDRTKWER